MSQIQFLLLLLMNLKQHIPRGRREYLPRDRAYELLKAHTGKDFGDQIEQWEAWVEQNPDSILYSQQRSRPVNDG